METTTSESIVRQAPYLEDFQKKLLEASFARGETPVDVPDIQVASIDPLTQQAMTTAQGIGQFQPYLTTGADTIGQGLSTLQAQAAGVPGLFTQAAQQATGTTGAYDPTSVRLIFKLISCQLKLLVQVRLAEVDRVLLKQNSEEI